MENLDGALGLRALYDQRKKIDDVINDLNQVKRNLTILEGPLSKDKIEVLCHDFIRTHLFEFQENVDRWKKEVAADEYTDDYQGPTHTPQAEDIIKDFESRGIYNMEQVEEHLYQNQQAVISGCEKAFSKDLSNSDKVVAIETAAYLPVNILLGILPDSILPPEENQ